MGRSLIGSLLAGLAISTMLQSAEPAAAQRLTTEPWDSKTSAAEEKSAARSGNPAAQKALAIRYETGDGVAASRDLAADYWAAAALADRSAALPALQRLAEGGSQRALLLLGRLLLADAAPEARARGITLLEQAGNAGSAEANFLLGTRLAADGDRSTRREAARRFVLAEKAGGRVASFARFARAGLASAPKQDSVGPLIDTIPLASDVQFDRGEPRVAKSLAYWGLSRDQLTKGDALQTLAKSRLFDLVEAAFSGDVVADYAFMIELERRCGGRRIDRWACSAMVDNAYGVRDSAFYSMRPKIIQLPNLVDVGKVLEAGLGGPADPSRARAIYEMASEKGDQWFNREASYRLSQMLEKGIGGPADRARAAEKLHLAADNGQPIAAFAVALDKMRMGDMEGLGFYLRAAADAGNADAAYYYARLLSENKILTKNGAAQTFQYFQQAADAGNKDAFYAMGEVYWNGWGVPVDQAKAENWWMASAKIGDPKAADHVAGLFGQRGDWAGAIPWLKRAAQGGYPGAQAKLNEVLAAGYQERNLGGFFMSVFQFVGDFGEGMAMAYQAQHEAEQAEIRRSMAFYVMPAAGSDVGGSSVNGSATAADANGGASGGGTENGSFGGDDAVAPDFAAGAFGTAQSGSSDSSGNYGGSVGGGSDGGSSSAANQVSDVENVSDYDGSPSDERSSSAGTGANSGSVSGAIIVEQLRPPTGPTPEEIAAQQRAVEFAAQQAVERAALAKMIKEGQEAIAADMRDFETNPCRNYTATAASCYPNAGKKASKVSSE